MSSRFTVNLETGIDGRIAFEKWIEEIAPTNDERLDRLKRNLSTAISQELTSRQRQYIMLYYGENMRMEAVAKELGVNKSSVSRTIRRGLARLQRALKYSF